MGEGSRREGAEGTDKEVGGEFGGGGEPGKSKKKKKKERS